MAPSRTNQPATARPILQLEKPNLALRCGHAAHKTQEENTADALPGMRAARYSVVWLLNTFASTVLRFQIAVDQSFNVAPQTSPPITQMNRDTGEREVVMMRWGLVPFWAKDAKMGYITINAKAETIATTPAFRESARHRRVLHHSPKPDLT